MKLPNKTIVIFNFFYKEEESFPGGLGWVKLYRHATVMGTDRDPGSI
jgi:hypothetical protein